jgi:hypothetical protein
MQRVWDFTEEHEVSGPILEDNRLRQATVSKTGTMIIIAL